MGVDQEQRPEMTPREAIAQIGYLRDLIEETRIRVVDGYREIAMWGAIWTVGYGLTAWFYADSPTRNEPKVGWMWMALVLLAVAGHVVLGRGYRRDRRVGDGRGTALGRRLMYVDLAIVFALLAQPFLHGSASIRSSGAYFAFWVGLAYVINGIFVGRELVAIGCWMFVVCFVALGIESAPLRSLWLSIGGGGGLLLTGAIFYRASRRRRAA
jgi:hypothetical protein